jgi:hypothetical protein
MVRKDALLVNTSVTLDEEHKTDEYEKRTARGAT